MNNNYQGNYGGYQGNWGGSGANSQGGGFKYAVDMVLCIDATGSMEDLTGTQQKIINVVKQNALRFYDDLQIKMKEHKKTIAQLRVRVIYFRDYMADGPDAMRGSDFFLLPQQKDEFKSCIDNIHAAGGGDIPEDGLEALAFAMRSKWTEPAMGTKRRHVVVVWTDAGTHVLGHGKNSPYYPKGMPANLAELEDWWNEMDHYARRLVLFTPDANFWNYIYENFEQTYRMETTAGAGMADCGYENILEMLAQSLS